MATAQFRFDTPQLAAGSFIPMVKIFTFLGLEQKLTFFKNLMLPPKKRRSSMRFNPELRLHFHPRL
jgi:hypothetical protein